MVSKASEDLPEPDSPVMTVSRSRGIVDVDVLEVVLASGDPVVNLSIATSESWRDKATGERKEKTEWHRVVIFNENIAKVAEQYLKKGAKVYIEGQLQTRKYTDKDGHEKYSTEVVLQRYRGEMTMLDSRGSGEGGEDRASRPVAHAGAGAAEGGNGKASSAPNWTTDSVLEQGVADDRHEGRQFWRKHA